MILQDAVAWAQANYPDAPLQHRAAFANSVAYLVTGFSGGFGGPSIREHLVSWSMAGETGEVSAVEIAGQAMTAIIPDGSLPSPGYWDFESATAWCENFCFGPIEDYRDRALQIMEREHCFDDAPEDLDALREKSA